MNILFILPEYYPHSKAGISTYYLHYIKAIKPNVNEVKILVGSGYTQADQNFNLEGVCVEYLKPNLFSKYFDKFVKWELFPDYRNNISAAWAMWDQARQGEGFDLIECTDFGLGFVPWLINHTKPVIVRLHGSSGQIEMYEPHLKENLLGDLYRHTELTLLEEADQLSTHSQENKAFWEKTINRKIQLIEPIFETQKSSIAFEDKAAYGIVTGRIQEWKGPDILCKAIAEIKDEDLEIRWYGRDTRFNTKKSKSEVLLEQFPGIWGTKIKPQLPIKPATLSTLQQKAKFAIIPSNWDMYNLTGLEYLNAGTVLICSDGAGVSEIIEDGINGFKYAKNDYTELANCIRKVIKLQKSDYERIVNNGKAIFKSKLSVDKLVEKNLESYRNTILGFTPSVENVYKSIIFEPNEQQMSIDEILNKQPIRKLVNYLFRRLNAKLR